MIRSDKTGRDLDAVKVGLQIWFDTNFDRSRSHTVREISTVATGGLSNETLIIDVDQDGSVGDRYVLRAPPPGDGLFPEYNLQLQGRIQTLLVKAGIPAAAPLAFEADHCWIGCQFLLMPMLSGRPPSDFPCYIDEGWVRDLTPSEQTRMVDNFLSCTARMNLLDIETSGLIVAARSTEQGSRLAQEFAWWKDYLNWIVSPETEVETREVARVVDWCERHWPDDEPTSSFVWGDARPPNALFADDLSICGALDFENAGLGPAEVDLGTWLTYRQNLMAMRGGGLPELPGYPDRKVSIEMFEGHLGRRTRHMVWHEMFASMRQGAAVIAIKAMWRKRGLDNFPVKSIVPEWQLEAMGERVRS